jgi:hypothetical protein
MVYEASKGAIHAASDIRRNDVQVQHLFLTLDCYESPFFRLVRRSAPLKPSIIDVTAVGDLPYKGSWSVVSRAIAHSFSGELKYEPVRRAPVFAVELIPLREWQKVTGEYGSATVGHQNSYR